jgi:hypothetical protein
MSRSCIDFALGSLHWNFMTLLTTASLLHYFSTYSFTVHVLCTHRTYTIDRGADGLGIGVQESEFPFLSLKFCSHDRTQLLYFQVGPQT